MDNGVSKILVCIGILIMVIGCLSFIAIGSEMEEGGFIIGGVAISVISGIQFIAFGEIVSLLQQSVDNQKHMFDLLNKSDEGMPGRREMVYGDGDSSVNTGEITSESAQSPSLNKKRPPVAYWCENCGKEGPYFGACPACGNASITYESPNKDD